MPPPELDEPADAAAPGARERAAADEAAAFRRLYLFIGVVTIGLVPGIGWLATIEAPARPEHVPLGMLAIFIGAFFLAAELVTIDVEFRHESINLSFSWVPLLVGFYLLAPIEVLTLKLLSTLLVLGLVHRQPLFKLAVNVACALLEVEIVTLVLVSADRATGPMWWASMLVAAILADLLTATVVASAISIFEGSWEPATARSMLEGLPMAALGTAIAAVLITLIRRDQPEAALVVAIGAVVVLLLKAWSVLRARHERLRTLDGYTRALAAAATEGQVLTVLLEQAAEVLHADRAFLVQRDGGRTSRIAVVDGRAEAHEGSMLDERILGAVGGGAARFHADDAPIGDHLVAAGIDEAMVARLSSSDHDALALVVADRSGDLRPFDDEDQSLFETLAVHAGLALQNMALVDRLHTEIESTEHMATHDSLTELPNRVLFQRTLEDLLASKRRVAVILLDLDRFKEVNDTLGHHNGDLLLIEVGQRLRAALRPSDVVARLGGDEFAVVIVDCADEEAALEVARRIRANLDLPFALAEVSVDVGASIGIALSWHGVSDGATLLREADVAMYCAKGDGSAAEIYSPDRDHYSPQRLALFGKLRRAIDHEELTLVYQPQLHLATGEVVGVEALVRWPQPSGRAIPPDDFIYIAEHTGLIRPLSQLVLRQAVAQAAAWHRRGRSLRVSANLSAPNLSEPTLVREIGELLEHHELPPDRLTLEVTESVVMANPHRCVAALRQLRGLGINVAIDDFGTGHSSLAYLTSLPATELKIDRSFVLAMATDPAAATLVGAIVDLGRNLGFDIVAEGVETQHAADTLRRIGCEHAQGYFFARPMSAEQLEVWLHAHDPAALRAQGPQETSPLGDAVPERLLAAEAIATASDRT